jgi:RNA polymerase sigma-70 factor, ECF subfamily
MHAPLPGTSGLIHASRAGDRQALGKLLDLYAACLRVAARQQLSPQLAARVGASDLVQETCLEACRHIDTFAGTTRREFSGWLEAILRTRVQMAVRDNLGRQKRDLRREQSLAVAGLSGVLSANDPSASTLAMQGEEILFLAEALEELSEDHRLAIRLRYLEGLPLDQMALRLERSPVATIGLLKRAVRALRERLHAERREPTAP